MTLNGMTLRGIALATVLALTAVTTAHADGLLPRQAQVIDLGDMSGVAYYTAERSGYRVVATFAQNGAQGEAGTPVRFEAVLAPGQSVVLSTPRAAGRAADAVEISRENDTMLVCKAVATVTN